MTNSLSWQLLYKQDSVVDLVSSCCHLADLAQPADWKTAQGHEAFVSCWSAAGLAVEAGEAASIEERKPSLLAAT